MNYDEALKHVIFRYVSGSNAYGTEREDSDKDYRGVFIAPLSEFFRLYVGEDDDGAMKLSVQQVEKPGEDETLYELRKFLKLAADCNPNIIEALFVDRLISHRSEIWNRIQAHRELFVSKKARFTFSGYAIAQLKRIRGHRGYLLNPPSHKPTREEFGLKANSIIAGEQRRTVLSLKADMVVDAYGQLQQVVEADIVAPAIREEVEKERRYEQALKSFNAYQKWNKERNPARKELEAKFGFDVKHAMHLVRLLRMGAEILETGQVHVYRPDREELRGILRGEWSYDRLEIYAEEMDVKFTELYETSTLRDKPDRKGIEALYRLICEQHYGVKL